VNDMASGLKNTSTPRAKKEPGHRGRAVILRCSLGTLTYTDGSVAGNDAAGAQAASGFTIFSTATWNWALIGAKASWAVLAATSLTLVVWAV